MNQKIIIIVLAAVFGAFVLTPCANSKDAKQKALQTLTVRLSWLNQAQFAGLYLAKDKGFYRECGLDVELKPGGMEYPSMKMIAVGSDEIGLTSADQVLLARSKGVPVVALAAMYQKSPAVLFTLKKSGIVTAYDLRGKRIGIKYGDNSEIPIRAMFRNVGLDHDFTEVPVSYDPSPLIQGQVDAFADWAINAPISVEEKGYAVNLIFPADYGINMYADVIFTTEDVLKKKRSALVCFLHATMKGYEYAIEHSEEAIAATLKRDSNLRKEHESRMFEASVPLWKPEGKRLGEMKVADWSRLNDILVTTGLMKKKVRINQAVNLELLREAYKDAK